MARMELEALQTTVSLGCHVTKICLYICRKACILKIKISNDNNNNNNNIAGY